MDGGKLRKKRSLMELDTKGFTGDNTWVDLPQMEVWSSVSQGQKLGLDTVPINK